MKRRDFITLLGGAAATWPLAARAQQGDRIRRIGVLLPANPDDTEFQARVGGFLQGLQQGAGVSAAMSGLIPAGRASTPTPFANMGPNWPRSRPMSFWPTVTPPWPR
jgi:hypothetical protein